MLPLKQKKNFENRTVRTKIEKGCRQTDRKYKRKVSDAIPFKQKNNFENRTIRTQNERLLNGRMDKRMDRRTKSIKVRSLMSYLSNKKRILKIGQLELKMKLGTDGQTDRQTVGNHHDVNTYFTFFN